MWIMNSILEEKNSIIRKSTDHGDPQMELCIYSNPYVFPTEEEK